MRKLQKNAFITLIITLFFACAVHLIGPERLTQRKATDFKAIPMVLDDWNGYDMDSSAYKESVPNSSLLVRDYVNSRGQIANLTLVHGTDIAEIHKPEYCFQGQGWKEIASRPVRIARYDGNTHYARLLILKDSSGVRVVCVYWYVGSGGATDSLAHQRYRTWKHTLMSRRINSSALVRILVADAESDLEQSEKDAKAFASLVDEPVARLVIDD